MSAKRNLAAISVAVVVASAVVSGCSSNSKPGEIVGTVTTKSAHAPAKTGSHPAAADLTSLRLDDRSAYGVPDIWVTYAITNHSSKRSDYEVDWEALNSSGVRVSSGTEFEQNVSAGETLKGSDVTTLNAAKGIKLHVISVSRTASL